MKGQETKRFYCILALSRNDSRVHLRVIFPLSASLNHSLLLSSFSVSIRKIEETSCVLTLRKKPMGYDYMQRKKASGRLAERTKRKCGLILEKNLSSRKARWRNSQTEQKHGGEKVKPSTNMGEKQSNRAAKAWERKSENEQQRHGREKVKPSSKGIGEKKLNRVCTRSSKTSLCSERETSTHAKGMHATHTVPT